MPGIIPFFGQTLTNKNNIKNTFPVHEFLLGHQYGKKIIKFSFEKE